MLNNAKTPNNQFVDLKPTYSCSADRQTTNSESADGQRTNRNGGKCQRPDRLCPNCSCPDFDRSMMIERLKHSVESGEPYEARGGTSDLWR